MFYLVVPLYLIEILHQTTTATGEVMKYDGCILLKFYIKPQPSRRDRSRTIVVSYWNSTSNHNRRAESLWKNVVVSYWNSTSNHNWTPRRSTPECVVSYWNSTSNHNGGVGYGNEYGVVSYWNSTSNHNKTSYHISLSKLYLIEILHQTTTVRNEFDTDRVLYLIEILHQTTTTSIELWSGTSLYLIEILHQTTTRLPREIPA